MIEIPKGISLFADEFGKKWPIVGATEQIARRLLAYADTKTHVPSDADLVIEFEAGNQPAAEALKRKLYNAGYRKIETEVVDKRHDVGGESSP